MLASLRDGAALGAAASLLALLSGDVAAAPSGKFVDCRQNPQDSVSVVVDTSKTSTTSIGDAQQTSDRRIKRWRDEIEVISWGKGELTVAAGGFGPRLTFNEVARGEGFLQMEDTETGNRLVVSLPHLGAPLTRPLVEVAYYC